MDVRIYHYVLLKKPLECSSIITVIDNEGNVVIQFVSTHSKTDFDTAAKASIRDVLSRVRKMGGKIVSFHTNTNKVLPKAVIG